MKKERERERGRKAKQRSWRKTELKGDGNNLRNTRQISKLKFSYRCVLGRDICNRAPLNRPLSIGTCIRNIQFASIYINEVRLFD